MIIDSHCHLDDEAFDVDLDEVLSRCDENGIEKIVIPGADPLTLQRATQISQNFKNIYFAVGVHPDERTKFDENELIKFIQNPKCVAVGECGLDYFNMKERVAQDMIESEKEAQKQIFTAQINLAKRFNKPLIIHSRDANADMYEMLLDAFSASKSEQNTQNFRAVLHCFNASKLLLELKKYEIYFGIGGVLTFKNAKNLVEILPQIPLDRILIETDAPYLAPMPHRGKRNEPTFTTLITAKIGEILNLPQGEIEEITTNNAKKFFDFKE